MITFLLFYSTALLSAYKEVDLRITSMSGELLFNDRVSPTKTTIAELKRLIGKSIMSQIAFDGQVLEGRLSDYPVNAPGPDEPVPLMNLAFVESKKLKLKFQKFDYELMDFQQEWWEKNGTQELEVELREEIAENDLKSAIKANCTESHFVEFYAGDVEIVIGNIEWIENCSDFRVQICSGPKITTWWLL